MSNTKYTDLNKHDLVRLVARLGYDAYRNSLVGNPAPAVEFYLRRAKHPRPGDLVVETTCANRFEREESVGELIEVKMEPCVGAEALREMHQAGNYFESPNETVDTIPKERIWYVRPVTAAYNSTPVRWVNADFIAIDISEEVRRTFMAPLVT